MQLQNLIQGKDLKCTTAFSLSLRPLLFSPLGVLENTIANNHKLLFLVWMGRTPCWSNFWQGISVFKKKKTHIQGEIFKQENRCSCTILYLLYVTVHSFVFFLCSTRKVRQNYISKLSHCKHSLICLQTPESIQQEYLPTQAKIQLSQSLLQQPPLKTANRKL